MIKNLKALTRLMLAVAVGLPAVAVLAVAQGIVAGPLLRDHNTIPTLFYRIVRGFTGIRVEFNKAAAPIERKRPTWFVANHTSYGDFIVLGSVLRGVFAGKGEFLAVPVLRQFMMLGKYIGLRRDQSRNGESIGKIIRNFNRGNNTIMFPEATIPSPEPERGVSTGDEVYMFHDGLFALTKGEKGKVKSRLLGFGNDGVPVYEFADIELHPEIADKICVQPVAITVKDKARQLEYTLPDMNPLRMVWNMLKHDVTVEVTPFPVLDPKKFASHRDMTNEAHRLVASKVNPAQTEMWSAYVPGNAKPRKRLPVAQPYKYES